MVQGRRFGRSNACLGASGSQARPAWGMRRNMLSPNYKKSVHEIPPARC
ncbi:DUF4113 domain-containing protein [Stenotrophomonas maltophilia]|nr:DUF4113 domain-containing protein [Stenotrophomonas maltophilia]